MALCARARARTRGLNRLKDKVDDGAAGPERVQKREKSRLSARRMIMIMIMIMIIIIESRCVSSIK